ncbi:MAG: dihydrodipicolinate synthase family protein [Phycisphaerae bacterium]
MSLPMPTSEVLAAIRSGCVIPAHPLALNAKRTLDEQRQRALTRYYLSAGAGGVAVGVHTTQFSIRHSSIGLFRPVLELAVEEVNRFARTGGKSAIIKIAGICGETRQAVKEAQLALELGYDIGLLSLSAMKDRSLEEMVRHARTVAEVLPIMGFYLQPAVGGRALPFAFWRRLTEIDNLVAIKIAPFNRYQTLDVVRAVAECRRADEVALYTGNDDNIIADLLTAYRMNCGGRQVTLRIVGGLLGHWAVWTRRAVEQLHAIHRLIMGEPEPPGSPYAGMTIADWLRQGVEMTDANAAFFDAANSFAGCIAGLHEVLRRQGLLEGRWCIDPAEDLSPGQAEEIDRVYAAYPHLNDDAFVAAHRDEWLGG